MINPIATLLKLFLPFNSITPGSCVTGHSGGSPIYEDLASALDRHDITSAGVMYAYPERRLAPPPFADQCRYHVVWHAPDGRIFVARNSNAPVMPPRPSDLEGPIGCSCRDASGQRRFGGAQSELSPWCPSLFKENDTAPYRPDWFSGYGPCTERSVANPVAQWEPRYLTFRREEYALLPEVVADLLAHDRLDNELRDIFGMTSSHTRQIPGPSSDPDAIREAWGFYAAEFQIERGDLGAKLVGRDLWEMVRDSEPALFEKMRRHGYFATGLIGAWFDNPVRDFAHIQMFLQRGLPFFYEWKEDMESFRDADVLRPRRRSLFVAGAEPPNDARIPNHPIAATRTARPIALPQTPLPVPAATIGVGASESSSRRRLADRISSPPPALAARLGPTPVSPSRTFRPAVTTSATPLAQRISNMMAYTPSGRLTERSALTFARTPHEFSSAQTAARVARLICEFNADGAAVEGPLRVWLVDNGKAFALAKQEYRNGTIRTPADLVALAREHLMAFNTAVPSETQDPWSDASAALHSVPAHCRTGSTLGWKDAFETWASACRELLARPHAQRAAVLRGGLLARIVRDYAPAAAFPPIPTDQVRLVGCPEPFLINGKSYHDDWLAQDELDALLGRDKDAAPGAPRSMFPPPKIWSDHAGGVWSEAHERWYTARRAELATGGGGASFYTPHRWTLRLRQWQGTFGAAAASVSGSDE